jgi:O-antigen/teichoic acid export membrane protein
VSDNLPKQAGAALVWKGVQLSAVNCIQLVRVLILARLLSPEDFGIMAIGMVVIGLLVTATDFGMTPALVQHTRVDERHYNGAWTIGVFRALTIACFIFAAAPMIARFFGEPGATNIIRVLALRPLFDGIASIKVAELTRDLRFRSLTLISVPAAVVDTLLAVALASHLGVWALALGTLAGSGAEAILSYVLAPHRPCLSLNMDVIRPLIRYGRWIFMTGLVAVVGTTVFQAVISRRLGVAELGVYFLAAKIAFLPLAAVSQVVGSVAFPLYVRLKSDVRQAQQAFQAILTAMMGLLVPIYTLLIVLAPSLVLHVLGPKWLGTTFVLQVLAFVGIICIIGEAVVPILKGMGQPSKVAVLHLVQSSLLIFLAWRLTSRFGVVGAALAYLQAIAVSEVFSVVFARQILDQPFAGLRTSLIAILLASTAAATVAFSLTTLLPGLGGFIAAASIAGATSWWLLWVFDRRFGLGLTANLPKVCPQVFTLLRTSPVSR